MAFIKKSLHLNKMKFKQKCSLHVKIITFESELEFDLKESANGQYLFDLVCRTIGVRESWYFGLQFTDSNGNISWLNMNKKVKAQHVQLQDNIYVFNFYAKFFPENVSEELIQDITQHLFFLQVKQSILSMDIYCRPEASVLLASYAVHVQYGPYDCETYKDGMLSGRELLPKGVTDKYQMTPEMWEERIKTWYMDHEPMTRDEVEMEYLKIAQDLDMYGVNYFPITNKNKTKLWLGVAATGLNIYDDRDKLTPKTMFLWNEIRHVSFDDKKFTIRLIDAKVSSFIFYSQNLKTNKLILDLCKGNHHLYMRRRKPDTMEIQQMKAQAKEEKQRRQMERKKFLREKKLREKAEYERMELEKGIAELKDKMQLTSDALCISEETKELYFEKNRVNEEQMQLTEYKANHFKIEMDRLRELHMKTELEKHSLEKKIRDTDFYLHKLTAETDKRRSEAEKLRRELVCAKIAEKEATCRLLNFLSIDNNANASSPNITQESLATSNFEFDNKLADIEEATAIDNSSIRKYIPSYDSKTPKVSTRKEFLLTESEIDQIADEVERDHLACLQKSKQVQDQLQTLRTEIDILKIAERQGSFDVLSEAQIKSGETKYSTLKKLKSGTTKSRVAFFEEL